MSNPIRQVAIIFTGIFFFSVATGYSMVYFALELDNKGYSASEVGINAAAPAIGILFLSHLARDVYRHLKFRKTLVMSCCIIALSVLLMSLQISALNWFFLRFFVGLGVAWYTVIMEASINALVFQKYRARIIGAYLVVSEIGFALGTYFTKIVANANWDSFSIIIGFFLISAAIAIVSSDLKIEIAGPVKTSVLSLAMKFPLAMTASLVTGLIATGIIVVVPVSTATIGLAPDFGILLVTSTLIGGIVSQPVLTILSDILGRIFAIILGSLLGIATSLTIIFSSPTETMLLLSFFGYGAAIKAFHGAALTLIGDKASSDELTDCHAAILSSFVVGNILGPLLFGYSVDIFGIIGIGFLALFVCFIVLILTIAPAVFAMRPDTNK